MSRKEWAKAGTGGPWGRVVLREEEGMSQGHVPFQGTTEAAMYGWAGVGRMDLVGIYQQHW